MTTPRQLVGVSDVLPGQGVKLMARVANVSAALITQASITSIAFTISAITTVNGAEVVTEIETGTLAKTDVVFDALQTGGGWDVDATGFNLAWIPTSGQLATAGQRRRYSVVITPSSGPTIPVLWPDQKARAI